MIQRFWFQQKNITLQEKERTYSVQSKRLTFSVCHHTKAWNRTLDILRPLFPSPFGCLVFWLQAADGAALLPKQRLAANERNMFPIQKPESNGNIYTNITPSSQLCENCWKYQKSYKNPTTNLKDALQTPCKQWINSVRTFLGATYSNKSHHSSFPWP